MIKPSRETRGRLEMIRNGHEICVRCKRTNGIDKKLTVAGEKNFIDEQSGKKVTVKTFKCSCGFEKQTTTW